MIDNIKNKIEAVLGTKFRHDAFVVMSCAVLVCFLVDIYAGLWQLHETSIAIFYSEFLFGNISMFVLFVYMMCHTKWRAFFYNGIKSWNLMDIAASILYVFIVLNIFSSLKSLIPIMNWYWMDNILIDIENFVHFGFFPADFFYKNGAPLWLFDFCLYIYFSWFFVFYIFIVMSIFGFGRKQPYHRFLIAFGLCWLIIGCVMATVFSSAGPVFMQDIYGDMRFAAYEEYFMAHAGYLAKLKTYCADMVRNMPLVDYNAVSAMPSMHISITALVMFYIWDYAPRYRVWAVLYLIVVQISCVILLMHYAIDGYVSVLATWVIWRWARRYDKETVSSQTQDAESCHSQAP